MPRQAPIIIVFCALAFMGAGCIPPLVSTPTAEPLVQEKGSSVIAHTQGFGKLPTLSPVTIHGAITLQREIPALPTAVTVIRLAQGDPNDVQLRNIANALSIPSGVIGNKTTQGILQLEWTDDQGFHWTYRATERQLEFKMIDPPALQLSLTSLPPNTELIRIANDFFQSRSLKISSYRDPLVEPDWNNWWITATANGLCMDGQTLFTIRAIGSSEPLLANTPTMLPTAKNSTCVSPEFPSRIVVRYHALVDGRDVLTQDGRFVNGAELIIDVSRKMVIAGRITLFPDPDRSDYPALSKDTVLKTLAGTDDHFASTTLSAWSFASMRVDDFSGDIRTMYLVPALIGEGSRVTSVGASAPARVVIPLLKP